MPRRGHSIYRIVEDDVKNDGDGTERFEAVLLDAVL